MGDTGPARARQANHRVKASSWLEGIVGVLGLAWFVILFAIGFHIGPLLSQFERHRVLFGGLELLGGLVVVYASLQIPPFQRRPFSWSSFAYGIVSAAGFIAVTYGVEAMYFPMVPTPDPGDAIGLGALLLAFASYRVPNRLFAWINRRIRRRHVPEAPANHV